VRKSDKVTTFSPREIFVVQMFFGFCFTVCLSAHRSTKSNVVWSAASRLRRRVPRLVHNVCVSSVVRFRSRVLSPTPNVERRYKLWATRHRTIEETFCWVLGRVNRYLSFATCLKSTVAFC
jgi:hypothetical protein